MLIVYLFKGKIRQTKNKNTVKSDGAMKNIKAELWETERQA